MNKEQISLAVNAGLELLGPDSQVQVPARLNDGVFFLRQFLGSLAQGRLAITPVMQSEDKPGNPGQTPEPPKANRQQRRAAERRSKKVSKKKT